MESTLQLKIELDGVNWSVAYAALEATRHLKGMQVIHAYYQSTYDLLVRNYMCNEFTTVGLCQIITHFLSGGNK